MHLEMHNKITKNLWNIQNSRHPRGHRLLFLRVLLHQKPNALTPLP